MLSVVMINEVMLSVVTINVVMLSVVMLNVVLLNVVEPFQVKSLLYQNTLISYRIFEYSNSYFQNILYPGVRFIKHYRLVTYGKLKDFIVS